MATQKMGMFKPQLHHPHLARTFFLANKPCTPSPSWPSFSVRTWPQLQKKYKNNTRDGYVPSNVKAAAAAAAVENGTEISISVKVTAVTLKSANSLDKSLLLEFFSDDLDPETQSERKPISGHVRQVGQENGIYESEFVIPGEFGRIGAVLVENEHSSEIYLQCIILDFPNGPIAFDCSSWIQPKSDNAEKRVFFTTKSYIPSQSPKGLERLRKEELVSLRGNGEGKREPSDRIYDYDVYNDLGDPDRNPELARPVLGGSEEYPYPRRCRTGRPRCITDTHSETRSSPFYVPRDEQFSEVKMASFSQKAMDSGWYALIAYLNSGTAFSDDGFSFFSDVVQLYTVGIDIDSLEIKNQELLNKLLGKLVSKVEEDGLLKFEIPAMLEKDELSWLWDEEFSRQTLAGINPCSIKLVTEWPLKSTLDPAKYGPPESAITKELVEREIKGFMSVDEALKQKKLFIIDYHDLLLPNVEDVRKIKGTTLYGSRALFFLTPDGTLKPVAIELTRPPMEGKPHWKQVFSPTREPTGRWLWRFAKVHFLAHDSGYHQLVSHWLRTHCATEPYVIATNRQLSAMHPIYRLLHPHFRYTMHINALARQNLINADGIIESSFSPGKYSMALSSIAYDKQWRFDWEALPADLINRGIAVEDPTAPHGLKLSIEHYPYANDGLILWDALKEWVTEYVNYYYKDASMVQSDQELEAWWEEIRTKGHEDKKEGWPALKTPADLVEIITTIAWVASGHHAAVNFGQYAFAGYFLNRPAIARTNMPCEDPTEEGWKQFLDKPNSELLACLPSRAQAAMVVATLDVLSDHSWDEEYLGKDRMPAWDKEPALKEAFNRFSAKLVELGKTINEKNNEERWKNRNGAGVVPYELLKPFSKDGKKGVPYSISI